MNVLSQKFFSTMETNQYQRIRYPDGIWLSSVEKNNIFFQKTFL